jgi:hypothetical protein
MLHFNDLTFCATPAFPKDFKAPTWLTVQLGFIAGRLYFEWEEYDEMRDFLGLTDDHLHDEDDDLQLTAEDETNAEVTNNRIDAGEGEREDIGPDHIQKKEPKRVFTSKPRAFLHEWIAAKRKNQDWTHTAIGFLAQGKALTSSHPFFSKGNELDQQTMKKAPVHSGSGAAQKDAENIDAAGFGKEETGGDDDDLFFDAETGLNRELLDGEEGKHVDFSGWERVEQGAGWSDSEDDDDNA